MLLLGLSVEGGGHCWGCQWREGGIAGVVSEGGRKVEVGSA